MNKEEIKKRLTEIVEHTNKHSKVFVKEPGDFEALYGILEQKELMGQVGFYITIDFRDLL